MTSQKIPGLIALLALLALSFSGSAASQDFPNRPIRIVVGFTPGGGPDLTARYIAQKLAESLKQQVLVENRPGAGGTLAAAQVARAAPDGYTLLSVSSAHAAAAAIYAKLPYETKDLAGVTQTGSSKYVLVVAPSLKINSLRQLVAEAKSNPGRINFSSAGVGSGTHFAGEIFKSMAGIDVVHIPFKGIPEALTEVLTGRVHFFMAPIANSVAQVKDGRLLGLGVSSLARDPLLPDVPTISEAGVSGYLSELWFGLLAPAGVPQPVLARLNDEIARILRDADTRARWAPIGIEPRPSTPQEFDRLIRDEIALFAQIARAAAIKAE
jgi:tripartite-type tricarboxylate transporter receptor subunit TctC